MKNIAILLLLSSIMLLAGCDRYYYQEGKSFEECAKDRHECVEELKKRLGVVSVRPGSYEYEYMENCMKHRGYRLVTERELPLSVKRLDPHQSMRGKIYGFRRGVAGTLDDEESTVDKQLRAGQEGHDNY